ncbi:MAG: signal peptidase II [Patescibacteria group bacterium]
MIHIARYIKTKPRAVTIGISGVFLLVDQWLKYLTRTNPDFTYYLWKPWLGWEYFSNSGIAFSLPFPNPLLIIFTPLIILALFIFLTKQKNPSFFFIFGITLIIAGAISNLIDRVLFAATIDYLRLLTGVINLADVMIAAGAGLLVWMEVENKKTKLIKYKEQNTD